MIALTVNDRPYVVDVEPDTPLLWVLRDTLGLTGTKYGCGIAQCGACTVHIDGELARACVTPVSRVGDAQVTTIEGVAARPDHPVVRAWIAHDVPQCGYCQPGQILAATALLRETPSPSDDDISREMVNICRCGAYHDIRAAIHTAAEALQKGAKL